MGNRVLVVCRGWITESVRKRIKREILSTGASFYAETEAAFLVEGDASVIRARLKDQAIVFNASQKMKARAMVKKDPNLTQVVDVWLTLLKRGKKITLEEIKHLQGLLKSELRC